MNKKLLSVICAAAAAWGVFSTPVQTMLGSQTAYVQAASKVSAPKANKKAGTIVSSSGVKIKLSCATDGATIYYSVSGGEYKRYTKAFTITKSAKVRTYAVKDGVKSAVRTYNYKLTPKVTISVPSGEYDAAQTITLSSPVSGVKFYYTLDGTKPTKKSTLYTAKGITVSKTATLRIMAAKSGWTGRYLTREYTITSSQAANESILDDYTQKYGYNSLSANEKEAYARLFDAVSNYTSADIGDLGISWETAKKVYWAFDYDNPQFYWLADGCGASYYNINVMQTLKPNYSLTQQQAEKIRSQFEAAAQEIIDKALEKDSVYEQLEVINNELVLRTDYTSVGSSYISEASGPLVYGKALCEGYSKAFMYLAQSIGVKCVCVVGYAGESHMWNMVEVDGEWYHVDVTWNDPVGGEGANYNDYLLISDSTISLDHTVSGNPFTVPKTAAEDYAA